jgi:Flp pilus assembly protein TadB
VSPGFIGAAAAAVAVASLILARSLREATTAHPPSHPDAAALREAGWGNGLARWEACRAIIVASTLALVLASDLPALLALAAGIAPSMWIRLRAEAARDRARRAVTRIVAGAEAALRSGATLPEALRREAEATTDPLARRATLAALRSFDLGASLDAALRDAAADLRDRRVALAFETLAIGVEERMASGRVAELLAGLVDRLTFEERLDDEVRARASGARHQQRLLAFLVPVIAVLLVASMPSLADALATPLGRFVLIPGALTFEITGIVLARRIVNEALS